MKPYALLCLLVILFCVGCEQAEIPIADSPKCDGEKFCKCGCPDVPCYCTDCEKCGKKPEHKPAIAEAAVRRYEGWLYLNRKPVAKVSVNEPPWQWDGKADGWRIQTLDRGEIFVPEYKVNELTPYRVVRGLRR